MELIRDDDGSWEFANVEDAQAEFKTFHPSHRESFLKYIICLDKAFSKAKKKCEFEFLLTLFRVRGLDYSGIGDAYQTTLKSIPLLLEIHNCAKSFEATRNLQLWIYGHIVEASEPYEIICNLVKVSLGHRFSGQFYPYKQGGSRPESPTRKIDHINKYAIMAGIPEVTIPLKEIWDREFRNAIFHADYILNYGDVYTRNKKYTHEDVMSIVTRSIVYHQALSFLYDFYIKSYIKPIKIFTHPDFSNGQAEEAVVIVRDGHGAVGLKSFCSTEKLEHGKINWHIGRFTKYEINILNSSPNIALLPKINSSESEQSH